MKKLLIITLSLILNFCPASTAAANEGPCLEIWTNSSAEWDSHSNELYQISLNGDVLFDKWKLALDLNWGFTEDIDDNGFAETSSFICKGGYAVINNSAIRTDLTAGFYARDINWDYDTYLNDPVKTTSIFCLGIGADTQLNLGKRCQIYLSYYRGFLPQWTEKFYDATDTRTVNSLSTVNYKLHLLLTKKTGVALGYHCEKVSNDTDWERVKFSGYTVGIYENF